MRLVDLDPELIRWEERFEGLPHIAPPGGAFGDPTWHTFIPTVDKLADAQGLELDCPKCRNHRIQIAFRDRGVADKHGSRSSDGTPTRWLIVSGTSLEDLTLSPSIDCTLSNPNCWHGFIINGEATCPGG